MADEIIIADNIRLLVRRSARARRMTLRVPRDGGDVVLTLPPRVPLHEGRAFAESKSEWVRSAVARVPAPSIVRIGAVIPVGGRKLIVTGADIKIVKIEDERLFVPQNRSPGPLVQAFLKHLAHRHLVASCDRHTQALGRDYRAIVLRDTRSRWGSCSSDQRLMFSWRLAMAPVAVLDYVAAHEVAHLAHMDHSNRFWNAVQNLLPDYAKHRAWLRAHGSELMAWKFRDI